MKIKKAETFGQDGEWQIDSEFLNSVCKNAKANGHNHIYEEDVEDVILILIDMGYLTYENN